jgi:hypothetical protein
MVTVMLSGLFAGLAGVLYAIQNEFAAPDFVYFLTSGETVIYNVMGGSGRWSDRSSARDFSISCANCCRRESWALPAGGSMSEAKNNVRLRERGLFVCGSCLSRT